MAKKKVFSIGSALAQGLEETIESAQNHYGELRVDVLPINKIETDPDNPRDLALTFEDAKHGIVSHDQDQLRKAEELESLQSIASSIKTQGIINPITVYKFGEKYRLIAGERRTLASIIAGKTDIQARILDSKPNELKISLLQWIENIERSDLSLWERLKNLEKILAAHAKAKHISEADITVTELSHLIGCSKPLAMHYKAVMNADDHLKQLISENKIRNLEKASVLAGIESEEVRSSAILACLQGATLKQLKTFTMQSKPKSMVSKVIETRGRQTSVINFGTTKNVNVAKFILNSILSQNSLSHMLAQFEDINWDNPRSVAQAFKSLLKKLEDIKV